jgi:hypothetical protein
VRACRERARAPRAPKKIHQPSNDIFVWVLLWVWVRFCA